MTDSGSAIRSLFFRIPTSEFFYMIYVLCPFLYALHPLLFALCPLPALNLDKGHGVINIWKL